MSIPGQPSLTSTSLPLDHLNKSQLDTPIIYQTSLSHDNQSSSLDQANLKSASEFVISNFSNFQNLESSMGLPLKSHNSSVSDFSIMDDDESAEYLSKQKARFAKTSQDLLDMNSLFESIKVHLTNVTEKLSTDFHQVVETNNDFKKEVRQELDEMKKFLNEQKRVLKIDQYQEVTQPDSIPSSSFPVSSTPVLGVPVQTHASITSASSVQSGSSSSSDMQAQMMLLLTESFTKLSSALQDKSDTKSDWPKFCW